MKMNNNLPSARCAYGREHALTFTRLVVGCGRTAVVAAAMYTYVPGATNRRACRAGALGSWGWCILD